MDKNTILQPIPVKFLRDVEVHLVPGDKARLFKKGEVASVPGRLKIVLIDQHKDPKNPDGPKLQAYAVLLKQGLSFDEPEEEEEEILEEVKLSSYSQLTKMALEGLRKLGEAYEVADDRKDLLISKILAAQFYDDRYLRNLSKKDLMQVANSLTVPIGTVDETIKAILGFQEPENEES